MRWTIETALAATVLGFTALVAGGCFLSRTEVLSASDGRKVFGDYLVVDDTAASEKTIYRWNAGQGA